MSNFFLSHIITYAVWLRLREMDNTYIAQQKPTNNATSQPSPIGCVYSGGAIVFLLPCMRAGLDGLFPSSANTPPCMVDATVFIVPLATCIGAVLETGWMELCIGVLFVIYALVERKEEGTGATYVPPVEYDWYVAEEVVYICACNIG